MNGCCGDKLTVRVRFFAPYRRVFGGKERLFDLDSGTTAGELLGILGDSPARRDALFETPPGASRKTLKPHLVVMINGLELTSRGGLSAELRDGDVVAVLPLMGGG